MRILLKIYIHKNFNKNIKMSDLSRNLVCWYNAHGQVYFMFYTSTHVISVWVGCLYLKLFGQ